MNERELFLAALQIENGEEREQWLNEHCAVDSDLRSRIEALLSAHQHPAPVLATPAVQRVVLEDLENSNRGVFELPKQIGDYHLLQILGRGGMGVVYKALHTQLDKVVAFKVLHPDRMASSEALTRFEREMIALGKLDHPHLVRAMDAGKVEDCQYLVMEYLEGSPLSQLVHQGGPLPIADACDIARQVALGLQAIHEQGMVHRDIKPSNIILDETGNVKIFDLGLALFQSKPTDEKDLTSINQFMGTLDYMSPEQCDNSHDVDIRTDIYSLGATLYHLLTGENPFPANSFPTFGKLLNAKLNHLPPSVQMTRPDVPRALVKLIDQLLTIDPDKRPDSPLELADRLSAFTSGHDLSSLRNRATVAETDTANAVAPFTVTTTHSETRLPKRRSIPWGILAIVFAFGILGWLYGKTIIHVVTNQGVLRVDVQDPSIEILIKMDGVIVQERTSKREFTLKAKHGQIEVFEKNGIGPLLTKEFKLNRGKKTTISITLAQKKKKKPEKEKIQAGTWKRGPTNNVLPGIIPAPRYFDNIGRWQITTLKDTPLPKINLLKFSPTKEHFGVLFDQKILKVFSYEGVLVRTLKLEQGTFTFDWHPDGRHFLYMIYPKWFTIPIIKVLDLQTMKIKAQIKEGIGTENHPIAEFEPTKGDIIAMAHSRNLVFWRWKVEHVPQKIILKGIQRFKWAPDGKAFARFGKRITPTLHDLSGKALATFKEARLSRSCVWSNDGSHIAFLPALFVNHVLVFSRDGSLKGKLKPTVGHGINSNGTRMSGVVTVDGKPLPPLEGNGSGVYSPNEKVLVSASRNVIRIWNTKTRKLLAIILLLPNEQYVTFSAAGETLFATPKAKEYYRYEVEERNGSKTQLTIEDFVKRIRN